MSGNSIPTSILSRLYPALTPWMVMVLLAGCAERPGPEVLVPRDIIAPAGAHQVEVYAVTTRKLLERNSQAFGSDRAAQPSFVSFTISVPSTHRSGQIEWPERLPDPTTDFVTTGYEAFTQNTFYQRLASEDHDGSVGIFVHGYNYNFQEALFRTAQMTNDARPGMNTVLFSWPSEASATGYLADRDATDFSRDALTDLFRGLGMRNSIRRLNVLGHSMGARLVMEALRQLSLTGQRNILSRMRVVLAAPDIDIDLFFAQLEAIGPLPHPIVILVSGDDRMLRLSSEIAATRPRLGSINIRDPRVVAATAAGKIMVVDVTALPAGLTAHDRYIYLSARYFVADAGKEDPAR